MAAALVDGRCYVVFIDKVAVDDDPDNETPYYFPAPVVFVDGFEAGDPSAWSGTTP